MKMLTPLLTVLSSVAIISTPLFGESYEEPKEALGYARDITNEIPEIEPSVYSGFKKIPNVAQYGRADWSQVIGIARGISLFEAQEIAKNDPDITFFFHMKGYQMVLLDGEGNQRIFRRGDAVFFSGKPWWGEAKDYADGYIKVEDSN